MLDKIILSQDRRSATIHFDTHSFSFYHSEQEVMMIVCEMILEPMNSLREKELIALEDTIEIDLQLSLFEDAA